MAKHSDPLRRKHSKVCQVLDISETTFRSVVAGLFSVGMIDISTKSAVLRKLGHEGADKLMDMLEMKVDAKPERLSVIVDVMMQEEALRDVLGDLAGGKIPSANSRETNSSPAGMHVVSVWGDLTSFNGWDVQAYFSNPYIFSYVTLDSYNQINMGYHQYSNHTLCEVHVYNHNYMFYV